MLLLTFRSLDVVFHKTTPTLTFLKIAVSIGMRLFLCYVFIRTGSVLIGCYIEYGAKTERRKQIMEEIEVVLQRHEQ